jgi:hypothetical protein
MSLRAIILCKNLHLALQTDKIIAKLSLQKCVPIKKQNNDFSYAATDNINKSLEKL